jgi:hypothetical protein
MLVEPDAIAVAAAVDVELCIGENLVTSHDMAAIRAKLKFLYFPGRVDRNGALFGRKFASQSFFPGEINVGGDRDSLAIGTLPGGQSIQQCDRTKNGISADRASHVSLQPEQG